MRLEGHLKPYPGISHATMVQPGIRKIDRYACRMQSALLAARLLLAAVFLAAALGKLLDRGGSRRALIEFGAITLAAGAFAGVLFRRSTL